MALAPGDRRGDPLCDRGPRPGSPEWDDWQRDQELRQLQRNEDFRDWWGRRQDAIERLNHPRREHEWGRYDHD